MANRCPRRRSKLLRIRLVRRDSGKSQRRPETVHSIHVYTIGKVGGKTVSYICL